MFLNVGRARVEVANKDSPFLHGVSRDFMNTTDALHRNGLELFNHINKLRISIRDAEEEIKDLFRVCQGDGKQAVIYYTGHGEIGTGNWCFRDGTVSIEELHKLIPSGCSYPIIISDCCYSGNWADYWLNKDIGGFDSFFF